jgi:hypothetical protein
MKKVICMLAIAAGLIAASSAGAALVSGNGSVFYNLGGYLEIWDISGDYTTQWSGTYFGQPAEVRFNYTIIQDEKGKLTGTGTCFISSTDPNVVDPNIVDPNIIDANIIIMPFDIKGTVSKKDGISHVKARFAGKGTALFDGEEVKYRLSEKIDALIIADSELITGLAKESISVAGQHSEKNAKQLFDATLPADMNGTSTLKLDCHSNGRQIVATGELILSNGKLLNFDGGGSFDVKKSENRLSVKSGKSSLRIKIADENNNNSITFFNGKVLGQKLTLQ